MERPEGSFDPYEGEIPVEQPKRGTAEIFSNELVKQFRVARNSLNYPGRFAPPTPNHEGSTNEDGRDHTDGSGL